MIRGIYTSASGMLTTQEEIAVHSNNLANLNTHGFKQEEQVTKAFPEMQLHRTQDRTRTLPIGHRDPRPPIGPLNTGVASDGSYTNFTQGSLRNTNNPLDFALQGKGFFTIRMEDGRTGYTRNGTFKLNGDNELVTSRGRNVLGEEGPIQLPPDAGQIKVVEDGQIVDGNNRLLGQLRVTQFENPQKMRQLGDNLYRQGANNPVREELEDVKVRQGFLEKSNADPIKEMVDMIEANRRYEMHTKMIQQHDSTLQQAIRNVGRG